MHAVILLDQTSVPFKNYIMCSFFTNNIENLIFKPQRVIFVTISTLYLLSYLL